MSRISSALIPALGRAGIWFQYLISIPLMKKVCSNVLQNFFWSLMTLLHLRYRLTTIFCWFPVLLPDIFNPETYMQIYTPIVVQGGRGWWNPHWSFWYVVVCRNYFALSGKPLILSTRWGIFYGCWRYWRPVTSPAMVAIWILPRIRNQVKIIRNGNFCVFDI